ncbi:MAG: hypothetical protein B6D58_02380 [candidate division Zixibacteria bacterium 4484_95]|nr:MAG: hypothetical protein B6D58_02380 [candidate division Zixibacteria bacterium 4484_95]RKX18783.1 MAG: hypothetical protein DRP26_04595 [candidate division Zixibacteria bacterium]
MSGLRGSISKSRILFLKITIIVAWAVFIGRLICLQFIDREKFIQAANDQQNLVIDIQSKRGIIYDRNYRVLAQDIDSYSYYVVPEEINDRKKAERLLREITGKSGWEKKFEKYPKFLWVARKTSPELKGYFDSSGIESLNYVIEPKRIYPSGNLAFSLLGRVDIDNNGLSGLELQYNDILSGKSGKDILRRDGLGYSYLFNEKPLVEPHPGLDMVTTIDLDLQQIVEQELVTALAENNAAFAIGLFIEVGTGEILACAVLDSLGKHSSRNRTITDQYEPGSTFKIITAAIALSSGLFEPENKLCVENGRFRIGGRIIRDDHEYDTLTVEDIIVFSSNIGVSKIACRLGDQRLYKAIKEAGFTVPQGVDFPGEAKGFIQHPGWRKHYLASISFGHGISATPLQIVSLYGAIASGGDLYRPYFGKQIIYEDGHKERLNHVHKVRSVFDSKVAATLADFLRQVVTRGTATKASSDIVSIAGKTGTALKLRDDLKGYDHRKAQASFVGFFPADFPRVVGIVFFDEPKNSRYGGITAAPVFKRIAERYCTLPRQMARWAMEMESCKRKTSPNDKVEYITDRVNSTNDWRGEMVKLINISARYYENQGDKNLIPDFRGLTLRQALTLAADKGLRCKFSGSGIVTEQFPSAGKIYKPGTVLELRCKSG